MYYSFEHYARKLLASKGKTETEASALLIAFLVEDLAKLDAEIYGAHSLSPLFYLPEKHNSEDLGLF